jgi:16S rRNA (uracil1498-N3)-methyltransferase
MHRFFVSREAIQGDQVTLGGPLSHQIRDVLRLRAGETITVLDNSGWERLVELDQVERGAITGHVLSQSLSVSEPRTKISIYQALLKGQRFEFVLQKGTELGIVEFVPMIAERCVVDSLDNSGSKMERWKRIVREAAEQSHRGKLPVVRPAILFTDACKQVSRSGSLSLIPWEEEHDKSLQAVLDGLGPGNVPFSIHLFVGPEGGFSEREVREAREAGIRPITLGPRILRAETAGFCAAVALMYALGDLE